MKKRANEKKRTSKNGALLSSVFGMGIAVAALLALLSIFSIIGLASEKPHSLLSPISFFSIYASAFLGGFVAIKKNKERDALLCGALCGVFIMLAYSVTFWLVGIILNADSTPISWLYRAIIIVCALLGAIIGVNKTHKKSIRRKRRRK